MIAPSPNPELDADAGGPDRAPGLLVGMEKPPTERADDDPHDGPPEQNLRHTDRRTSSPDDQYQSCVQRRQPWSTAYRYLDGKTMRG